MDGAEDERLAQRVDDKHYMSNEDELELGRSQYCDHQSRMTAKGLCIKIYFLAFQLLAMLYDFLQYVVRL